MRKILGVCGSPRKNGNTHELLKKVLLGAESTGAETQVLFLGDLSIADCTGCHVCWSGGNCPLDDDMNALYSLISGCDGIVFGTPVYWYGPTVAMKAFLDRFVYYNCPEHHKAIKGKPVVVVSPFEENNTLAVQPLLDMFRLSFSYLGMIQAGELVVPGVSKPGEVKNDTDVMERAFTLGKVLAE